MPATPDDVAEDGVSVDAEARVRRILEATNAGTWEIDLVTNRVHYDDCWAAVMGFTRAEIGEISRAWWRSRLHPLDLERQQRDFDAYLKRGTGPVDFVGRFRHKHGHWLWLHGRGSVTRRADDGTPLRVFGIQMDITARMEAEKALLANQNFLARVGDIAGIGGWEADLATRELTWSDRACRIHDVPAGTRPSIDVALVDACSPEARPLIFAALSAAIDDGSPWDLELPMVTASGRAFWARSVASVEYEHGVPARLVGAVQDITHRKRMEGELARGRELLQVTLESIGDGVITTDIAGAVQWLNAVAERMTGWARADAVGQPLARVFAAVDARTQRPMADDFAACLAHGSDGGGGDDTSLVALDGTRYAVEHSIEPIRDGKDTVHGAVLVFRDVSEKRRLAAEMRHRATHDPLTGLVNRAEFEQRLARVFERASRDGAPVATLLYVDLDQFKLVNDACGHAAGDELLRHVSGILRESVRANDTVARLGGDEFGLVLEHCDPDQAARVAQKVCDHMEAYRFVHDERRFRIGTSIGLVPVDARWASIKAMLQAADASCFAAKEGGRNRVHAWRDSDAALDARAGAMQWVARLELALDENRFVLHAQRIVPIAGESHALHVEVLLRLTERDGTIVPPGAFLPAAERFHLATRIDRWVVRETFAWLERAHRLRADIGMVSINLSGQSLGDRAFHRDVCGMLRAANFDARCVCFEITETAAITQLADARGFVDELRALGARVALDDFGAGASSFGYLKSLPVDFIKIDGHFVTTILEDDVNRAAVRCFCEVAKVVGVKTIAEFVERGDVRDELRGLGVDMAQGYLVHRPEPIDALLARHGPAVGEAR